MYLKTAAEMAVVMLRENTPYTNVGIFVGSKGEADEVLRMVREQLAELGLYRARPRERMLETRGRAIFSVWTPAQTDTLAGRIFSTVIYDTDIMEGMISGRMERYIEMLGRVASDCRHSPHVHADRAVIGLGFGRTIL